jgi:hypothetical protein
VGSLNTIEANSKIHPLMVKTYWLRTLSNILDQQSKSTNAIFSNDPHHFLSPLLLSLSLPNPLSLSLSFSPLWSIPHHVLPVLIFFKYLTDLIFDYR